MFNDAQPRVPAGRHDGGQFTQADGGGRTQDLAPTLGDSAMVDAIVAAGAEAYVAGISAERVSTYLRTVGRNDLLAPDDAAMRLTPWEGFNAQGHPLRRKSTCLSKEQENRLVKATDEEPVRTYLTRKERLGQPVAGPLPWEYVRLTEEGRRVALENLLLEAHDTQALAARQLGFSDDAAEEYAHWIVNYRLAEATRNLGKPDRETLDYLATTLLTNGVEKYVTRPVPKLDAAYIGTARLGRAFEGTYRVGADFTRYVALLKPRNAETEAALWNSCARKRMDEALGTAWDAQFDKIKAKFDVEPIGYWEFYDPYSVQSRSGITPLNYRPAKENPQRLAEIRKLATSGDRQAMATVAAWDAAVKSAGSHNATMLSSGRSSVPFARNKVHRTIELPYKPTSMSVEGTRRGARYIFRYTDGLTYYRDGVAQFRNARPVSLNEPVGTDDHAAEFGDLLVGSRAGGSYRERAAVDPAEIYEAGQRYASAAAIAKTLPDNDENNAKLRDFFGIDLHEGIKDEQARDAVIARDITKARAEGMPEAVIRRLWKPQSIEKANTFAKGLAARRARAKAEAAAAQRRLHDLAAQRRAAQPAR
ncbi:hypothetical protein [Bifidobacterium bifidum]|uniref:hypothetical protein n=1 Tax=Bifidobacterium bifidum TaxID=1681 RepID=UPI000641D740|nr:hypothetical protein [Bifidobacterium bifidum]KLN81657.1 hypothetical protein B0085_1710 [Bifidobacterium bifidum]